MLRWANNGEFATFDNLFICLVDALKMFFKTAKAMRTGTTPISIHGITTAADTKEIVTVLNICRIPSILCGRKTSTTIKEYIIEI